MKRMAALLAVMGAMTAVVPAAAPAATATSSSGDAKCLVLVLRLC
jgi:hypothetical protein